MGSVSRPVIVHIVHALEGGGTEHTLVALLRAFDPSLCEHVVVTLREAGSLAARLPDHVACRPMSASGRSRSTFLKLAGATRALKAAVIHARNSGCWHDAAAACVCTPGARLVLGFHGLEDAQGFTRRRRRIARWSGLAGARFTTVSQAGRRQLQEEAGVPDSRIDVLENGVDLSRFSPADNETRRRVRAGLMLDDAALVVGTVGSLTPVKRHRTLIGALARAAGSAPEIQLLVVGDGPSREALIAQANAEGIRDRVHFTGWREDVPELLGGMDLYVCSSESEGMNNALLEAMASGLPLIATDVGDNAAIVRDGIEGVIVEPCATDALADAFVRLARSKATRLRFAHAARARAHGFDFAQISCAYERYYQSLLP